MNDFKVGDLVEYSGQGRVKGVDDAGSWVKLDTPFITYIPYADCKKIVPHPEAGEVWVNTDGTRVFLYFNSQDRLVAVSTHGRFFCTEEMIEANGWGRVDV